MKIVFCDNNLQTLFLFRRDVIRHFSNRGHKVILVYPVIRDDEDIRAKMSDYCRCEMVDMLPDSQNLVADIRLYCEFLKLYRKERPDVVINYTIKPNIYSARAAHSLGIRTIDFLTGLGYVFNGGSLKKMVARNLYKWGMSIADKVIVLNRGNYDIVVDKYVKADKLVVFEGGEGVNMKEYPFVENIFEDTRFLMVARVLYDKGYLQFVDAARIVKQSFPNVRFELLGEICEDSPMGVPKCVLDADVNEGVIDYLGKTSDVPSFVLRKGTVIVLPSFHEGMSRSLMEACSMGRPLITTDIPGCRELVDDGINGFLVEPKNDRALADACIRFLNLSRGEKQKMSKASYEKCKAQFDVTEVIKKYDILLDNGNRICGEIMKLSLITVAYNSAGTVRDTIESVLAQSYPEIEYIIKDGGSTDGTVEICREYEERFGGRMRIFSSKDDGPYDAMNEGIRYATGEVVGFLNSDDVLVDSGAVERQMKCLIGSNADAVYSDVVYKTKDMRRVVRYYSSAAFKPWKMLFGWMPAHPTFYCRKAIYEKYGGFSLDYKVAADYECLLRMLMKDGIRTVYNPGVMVLMRMGGLSNRNIRSHWLIMKDHLKACKEHGVYSNMLLQCLRFPSKVWDLLRARVRG